MTVVIPFFPMIAVSIMVRAVVVFDPAAISFPVACKVFPVLITRSEPISTLIWRPSPVTSMPLPMVSHRIPVALDPYIFRPGRRLNNGNDGRRWRRADRDVDGDLSSKYR